MEVVAEQSELFPVIERKASVRGLLWRYVQATIEHGPLLAVSMVAEALQVSRQRVHQLIDSGQLQTIAVGDRKFVAASTLELFLTEERKSGVRISRRWIYLDEGQPFKKSSKK